MKILVTGSAGFIGSHVARRLCQRGDLVVGLDCLNDYYSPRLKNWNIEQLKADFPQNFKFVKADILDQTGLQELFAKEKFVKICHLAARAGVRPSIIDPFLRTVKETELFTKDVLVGEVSLNNNITNA